jgi:hypothetical protein
VGLLPGFVEFGATGFFFGADFELSTDALADFFPVFGERAEGVGFCFGGGFTGELFGGEFLGDLEAALLHLEALPGDFLAGKVHLDFVLAVFGACAEIGEALKGEELGGVVIAGGGEFMRGLEDGFVDFFGEVGFFAAAEGIEFGEGELRACGDAGVDFVEAVELGVEKLERFAGDFEAEAFGARFGNAFYNVIVCFGAEPFGDLADFFFGEGGEGALFSHKWNG